VAPGSVSTPLWFRPSGIGETLAARAGTDVQTVVKESTSRIPIGRFTTAEEVGEIVAFLASPRAATITGTTIRIDGGLTPSV
jgi:3-oxoacyl-[acyl-carrier protein] reductase